MPITVGGKTVYDCTPEEFAAFVQPMLDAGVAVFGGCCGTTAEHIAALHAALKDAKFVPPAPKHTDLLPAATEKLPCYLPTNAGHGPVLTAGPDLEDRLADALDGSEPMVALRVAAWEDIDALTDVQYLLSKPLCLVCDDAELLEAALRVYQGRALYEGALPEAALLPLCAQYGLLI